MKAIQKLGNPIFIISLLILVLNDWYLKQTFSNSLTGKLSDFAGLFAFPFFLSALFPQKVRRVYVFTMLFFLIWKSPLVQPIIDILNGVGIPTHRTIDYTDYLALAILPFSFFIFNKSALYALKPIFINGIIIFSSLAFMATSMPPGENGNFTNLNKNYTFNFSKRELIARLNLLQVEYVHDLNKYGPAKADFDSKTNVFYYKDDYKKEKDTIAVLLDYEKIKDADTIRLRTLYAQMNISGNDATSNLKLLSLRGYIKKAGKGSYETKAIKYFERFVVKPLGNYK